MVQTCNSCGGDLIAESDHAGNDIDCPYCDICADHECELLSRKAVEKKLIQRLIQEEDADKHQARQHVQRHLDQMPAWN